MRYVTGIDEYGQPIDVRDPLRDKLQALTEAAGRDAEKITTALLGIEQIFGRDLPADRTFTSAVAGALESLFSKGAQETCKHFRSTHP
jgi:fructuronate reductase